MQQTSRIHFPRSLARWLAIAALLFFPFSPSTAGELNVVATTSSVGALAREIGAEAVSVRVLAPPDRDAHYLDARPSFMAALRRADLLLEMGAGLEEGWLPAAVRGAANPSINSGRPGRFIAAEFLHLRRSITMDEPGMGHVHAEGNPHFNSDPLRMAEVAVALGKRLAELMPERAEHFDTRARQTADQLVQRATELAAQLPERRIVVYHEDLDYLEEWLPVTVVGYLEPSPGVPPTARHLRRLVEELQNTEGNILHAVFQPDRGARFLEHHLGWPRAAVPLDPPIDAALDGYLELMATWVDALQPQ